MSSTAENMIKVVTHNMSRCLIVPIQDELSIEDAKRVQEVILDTLGSRHVAGVIIDFSGVDIVDSSLWDVFIKSANMIQVMGSHVAVTGLSPGIIASMIDSNMDTTNLKTKRNMEGALDYLLNYHK
ncbi:STAS domain-containing protein [Vibrio hepatarius]|uniref:STAS domain-containing protein n=1 Tax=Vibrio hepatarius TaxID=171383 RepID=UPI001C08360C|nr:STAS domain-containing protein [Vibrio hepatarius]MBU2896669.1 STAS domain-containing protein [Vibrio hepatarius]